MIDTGTAELFAMLQDSLGDILDDNPPPHGDTRARRSDTERRIIIVAAFDHLLPADQRRRLEFEIATLQRVRGIGRISAIIALYELGRLITVAESGLFARKQQGK